MSYKRCTKGNCGTYTIITPAGKPAKIPAANDVYTCATPSTTDPCPAPNGTCGCYIVATQHGPQSGGIDDAILDEKYYAIEELTVGKQKSVHSPVGKPAGAPATYWNIACTCLETKGGEPILALNVRITVPGGAYAATLRELRTKYGKSNVELSATPAAGGKRRTRAQPKKA